MQKENEKLNTASLLSIVMEITDLKLSDAIMRHLLRLPKKHEGKVRIKSMNLINEKEAATAANEGN